MRSKFPLSVVALLTCYAFLQAQTPQISVRSQTGNSHLIESPSGAGARVVFYDGVIPLGAAVAGEGGVARLARRLPPGKHFIRAVGWGDGKAMGVPAEMTVAPRPVSSFTSSSYGSGLRARAIAAGDFDGAGRLAVATATDGLLAIVRGPGVSPATIATVPNPAAMAAADLDGDGRMDAVVADASGQVAIHLNGRGQWTRLDTNAGGQPAAIAVADFNGDGIPDLAIANQGTDDISILTGTGDGRFTAAATVRTGASPRALIVADVDGNGSADLVTANTLSHDVRVHLGAGDATFRLDTVARGGESPAALAAGDFNEDGRIDLAVLDTATGTVQVLLRSLTGSYEPRSSHAVPGAAGLGAGDVNGDGHFDIAVSGDSGILILAGTGDGGFGEGPEASRAPATGALAIADFDGDGTLGIVAASRSGELTSVRAAQCSGASKLVFQTFPPNPATPTTIATTELPIRVQVQNSAGQALTSCQQTVTLDLVDRIGTVWADLPPYAASARETRDAGTTGVASFTTINGQVPNLAPLTGTGFVLRASANTGSSTVTATTPPFDIATATQTLHLAFLAQPANGVINVDTAGGYSLTVRVAVQDQNNQTVTTASGDVTLQANGPGNFVDGNSVQPLVNGVATVGGVLNLAGSYTLTASAAGVPTATSNSFTVSYSAPILEFSTQPATGSAGAVLPPFKVRVRGTNGATDTTSTAQVKISAIGPGAPTAGSTLTVTAVNGEATFNNVTFNTSGSYRLVATATGLKDVSSSAYTVNPGPATKVSISQQPAQVIAGLPFAVTAQVLDSFGNIAASIAQVSLSITPGPPVTPVAAVNGVATFTNLTLANTGTYTPAVDSAGLTGDKGSAFAVVSAPPAVSATALTVTSAQGKGTVLVTVAPGTTWVTANNSANTWLRATTAGGTGSRMATFEFDPNPSTAARTGTMTIAGITVTVTQQGTSYTPSTVVAPMILSGLNGPRSLSVNSQGSVHIADTGANAIRSLGATGQISTLLLSGIAYPLGVAIDSRGNAYIADTGSGSVKLWSDSNPLAPPTVVASGFKHPSGLAVDWKGEIYVADTLDNSIKLWSSATQAVTTVVSGLQEPSAVAADGVGNIYFAELGAGTVKKWDLAAQTATILAQNLNEPHGLAVDGRGNVYIAEAGAGQIRMWDAATNALTTLLTGLSSPVGVTADASGTVYIADASDVSQRPTGDITGTGSIRAAFAAGTAAINQAAVAGSASLQVSPASVASTAVSSQSWLTISSTAGGVVTYALQANATGANRTAIITVGGQQIRVTQSGTPPSLPKAISVKFVGRGTSMGSSELAGVVEKANWNNATGAQTGIPLSLRDEDGTLTGATVSWVSANPWNIPITDASGNVRMMRGYLDDVDESATSVRVAGLPPAPNGYDVYIYSDGDNEGQRKEVSFAIGDGLPVYCSDLPGTNFGGGFTRCVDGPGNYAVLSTMETAFTITATPISSVAAYRAPVNGIQIVARAANAPPITAPTPRTPARAIGIKFVGKGVPMGSAELAGVVRKGFWNNAVKAAGTGIRLRDEDGKLTDATIEYTGSNPWSVPGTDTPGNTRLMRGYLDNGDATRITIRINGLDPSPNGYDVYLYTDGDNAGARRSGRYSVNSVVRTCTDSANTNFTGTFVPCNTPASASGPGNYATWPLPTGGSLIITADPDTSDDPQRRSPVNAIQIIPR